MLPKSRVIFVDHFHLVVHKNIVSQGSASKTVPGSRRVQEQHTRRDESPVGWTLRLREPRQRVQVVVSLDVPSLPVVSSVTRRPGPE